MPLQHPADMPGMQEACAELLARLGRSDEFVNRKVCDVECGL